MMAAGAVTKKLFVVVNGRTYSQDDGLEIEADTDVFEDYEAMEANGFTAKCYRAGLTTWKISVAGYIVYHGTERPNRTETEDSITITIPGPNDTQEVDAVQGTAV